MSSKIGLIGKPNAGKSTLFSSITATLVEIANYPFTTVSPNVGVSFIVKDCPEALIGRKCNPNHGSCQNGKRYIPLQIVDVPGLIEGASQGKGMGNQFLQNLADADALIQVFDATDVFKSRNPAEALEKEINDIKREVVAWASGLLSRDWERFSRHADTSHERLESMILKKAGFLGLNETEIHIIISETNLPQKLSLWKDSEFELFVSHMFTKIKPIVHVANKCDLLTAEQLEFIVKNCDNCKLISAEYELALQKALDNGMIKSRIPPFITANNLNEKQKEALKKIEDTLSLPELSRPYEILNDIVENTLDLLVVYPVADDSAWTDKNGNILPDAVLMKNGSTPLDLAYRVHTDIGEGFIKAIDCKTRMVIGKDHVLSDGDIVRIVSKTR